MKARDMRRRAPLNPFQSGARPLQSGHAALNTVWSHRQQRRISLRFLIRVAILAGRGLLSSWYLGPLAVLCLLARFTVPLWCALQDPVENAGRMRGKGLAIWSRS